MNGVPVTEPVNVGWSSLGSAGTIPVPIGAWPSGLYFARLTAPGGRLGFAPFVLQPAKVRGSDGLRGSWCPQILGRRTTSGTSTETASATHGTRSPHITTVDLQPRLPPSRGAAVEGRHERGYVRWLARTRQTAPTTSRTTTSTALESGARLGLASTTSSSSRGHEEYVTTHAYDIVERYRDLGGNLMFLSANSFFFRVTA